MLREMARRRVALATMAAAIAIVVAGAGPACAHHVGTYVPRDNDVSANFKQLKFSLQARKFEVAGHLFETGGAYWEAGKWIIDPRSIDGLKIPAGIREVVSRRWGSVGAPTLSTDAPGRPPSGRVGTVTAVIPAAKGSGWRAPIRDAGRRRAQSSVRSSPGLRG